MNTVEQYGDWMRGISGSRRLASETTTEQPTVCEQRTIEQEQAQAGTTLSGVGEPGRAGKVTHSRSLRSALWGVGKNLRWRGDDAHLLEFGDLEPIDWIETIRGMLFFGIFAAVVWLEWVAIKAFALYVSTFV